ncbi:MAG: hypothetical protein V2I26_16060 [Halieaceae bacterium]|nr:hypothetical protein [Halieaceae bacterium]
MQTKAHGIHRLLVPWIAPVAMAFAAMTASLLLLAPPTAEGAVGENLSRFQRTVNYLAAAPPEEQADFALAALAELAAVYMAEADLARAQAMGRSGSGRARLWSWSVAVDQYAGQMTLLIDDVEQGFPVTLRAGQQGDVTITVAERAVMLVHPRPDQQAAYEQRVLSDFCTSRDCERITVADTRLDPIPLSAVRANPLWTFTERGPICSSGGIEVRFSSAENLPTLRGLCEQLIVETAALANELAWQTRHGVEIDWNNLAVSATPGRPEHLVRLNAAGDSLLLTVPLLHASASLLEDVKPWLHARLVGDESAAVRLDAEDYGWQ